MQKNKLTIRLAKKSEQKEILKFIGLNFKKDHILIKSQKLFKWQYQSKKLHCFVAKKGKNLLGIYLYVPLGQFDKKLLKNNQVFGSLWTVNGFRKKIKKENLRKENLVIALRMFQKTFQILEPDLDIAVGLDSRFYRFHKSQKYNKIKKLNHHFMLSPLNKKLKILDNSIFSKFKNLKKSSNFKIKYKEIKSLTQLNNLNIDNLFKHQLPTKSKSYLANRYLKHPIYKYKIFVVSKRGVLSLCVFRVISYKNKNLIRFVDYIGSNKSFIYLKNFFIEILKEYDAEYIDFYSFGIPLSILKKSGLKKKIAGMTIPNYFEPFVNENIDIHVGYRIFNNKKGNVRIFKADGDQDRPSVLK